MALAPGTRLGPYEVVAQIGVGGMGEVYRATDTNLKRQVAIKVLPEAVATDAERLARFQREAEVLASLNHPGIAAIYGLERTDGQTALVMELVEGPTLADRIAQGAIPVDEALPIAKQIAEALEAAHEQGIIHRDLKPANIKVRPDGTVKVLDFGLAKAMEPTSTMSPNASLSPTITTPAMTQAGMILGSAAYMSPEQARGKVVDKRADIWAFGCVLYEMLTGRRAFAGEDVTVTLARVMERDPDWTVLPGDLSPTLRIYLQRCLEKDPRQRLDSAQDVRLALEGVFETSASASLPAHSRSVAWLVAAALGVALVAALGVAATLYFRRAPAPAPEMRFEISAPGYAGGLTISPDGERIAYVATVGGQQRIWIRPLGAVTAQPVAGTDDAVSPFWSPDGRSLAFFAQGKLKKIDIAGGPPQDLAETTTTAAGDWNRDDDILFNAVLPGGSLPGIVRVSASGGAIASVFAPDATVKDPTVAAVPSFLPDGRHFLYSLVNLPSGEGTGIQRSAVYAGSLDAAPAIRLMSLDSNAQGQGPLSARYASPGYLLFRRGDRTLLAQPFAADRLTLSGEPVPLAENVQAYSVSDTGVVVYVSASNQLTGTTNAPAPSRLLWFDRKGNSMGQAGPVAAYANPTLSPDGRQIAVAVTDSGNQDVWIVDLARNVPVRLTFDPAVDTAPRWSPNGRRVVFASARGRTPGIFGALYVKPASGAGAAEQVFAGRFNEVAVPQDWSPDGKYVVFGLLRVATVNTTEDLWALPLGGDKKAFPLVQSPGSIKQAASIAPDGNWLAYTTNEAGTYQIVVQPFPDPTKGKWQVTSTGGVEPKWRRDGRELFYLGLDGAIMAVPVKTDGDAFEFGQPAALFKTGITVPAAPQQFYFDVTADGQRFLVNAPASASTTTTTEAAPPPTTITAIVNWSAKLDAKNVGRD